MGKKTKRIEISRHEWLAHRDDGEVLNPKINTLTTAEIKAAINFGFKYDQASTLNDLLRSDYVYPTPKKRIETIYSLSDNNQHVLKITEEDRDVRPMIEHLYYTQPEIFIDMVDRASQEKREDILTIISSACEQSDLSNELAVLLSRKTSDKLEQHLKELSEHEATIRAEVAYNQQYRHAFVASSMFAAMECEVATAPSLTPAQENESLRKADDIKLVVEKCSALKTKLFPHSHHSELSSKEKLDLLKNKLQFLTELHRQDKALGAHRMFGDVVIGNIATLLFFGGIPNIVNKIITGHFFFSTTPKSMQLVEKMDNDLKPSLSR